MARQVRPWLMKPENVRAPIECAKAGGGQPAEPIRDSGLRAAAKVRMYGCNRYLSAASREEKPGKGWGRPCTISAARSRHSALNKQTLNLTQTSGFNLLQP